MLIIKRVNYTSKGKTRVLDTTAPTAPAVASANGFDFIFIFNFAKGN